MKTRLCYETHRHCNGSYCELDKAQTESMRWGMIWDYFKVSRRGWLTRRAANVLAVYVYEWHHFGLVESNRFHAMQIAIRFNLCDYLQGCMGAFPPKASPLDNP